MKGCVRPFSGLTFFVLITGLNWPVYGRRRERERRREERGEEGEQEEKERRGGEDHEQMHMCMYHTR